MTYQQLFAEVSYTGTLPAGEAVLVTQDSRRVVPGAVFVCTVGHSSDGHTYAQAALEKGAGVIVTQRPLGLVHEVTVENSRITYARLCQNYFGRPADKLRLIAVTGTNGKSTVTTLIKQILEATAHKAGLIGTIHTEIDTMEVPAKFTTPEAWDIAALFSRMVAAGCEYVVLEASSQALDQMRLGDLQFEVAAFTNLTQDHLDYHGNFENYFTAKKILFAQAATMVTNVDDAYGKRLLAECTQPRHVLTYGENADFMAQDVQLSAGGVVFTLAHGQEKAKVNFSMPGEYSVYNALTAAAVASALGISLADIATALTNSAGVRGRCEVLYHGNFTVICDFAHTGDAIEKILSGIKLFTKGRLVALFGCAGERDAKKRPLMAQAVIKYADMAVLTSDNPRGENPYSIMAEVQPLLEAAGLPLIAQVERRTAVRTALAQLQKDDVLVLCGKGHEDYQAVDGITLYLDEHQIVREWLQEQQLLPNEQA